MGKLAEIKSLKNLVDTFDTNGTSCCWCLQNYVIGWSNTVEQDVKNIPKYADLERTQKKS